MVKAPGATPRRGSELTTVALWFGAAAAILFILSFLAVPWVSVLASGKAGLSLIADALKAGQHVIVGALLFAFVPVFFAIAGPLVPSNRPIVREWVATITAIAAFVETLILVFLSASTRNLLSLDGGRQVFLDEIWLLYITLAGVFTGAAGFLLLRDVDMEQDSGEAVWYAVFIVTALVVLYFNYSILPDSLIPPPEFIRERMGMLG